MLRKTLLGSVGGALLLSSGMAAAAEDIGGELNVLSWGDYIDHAIEPFEEKYGVGVNIDYYGSEQEAINKIRAAGLGVYDVVFLGVGYDEVAMQQGLIEPLDVSRLEHFDELYQPWQEPKDDGRHYCATYAWGANGLYLYNTEKIDEEITSAADVFSGKYEGRIARIDKANEQVWRNAQQLGMDIHPLTDAEWQQVEAKMLENLEQARTVFEHYDQMTQLVANGEVWIADTDDGAFRQALKKGLPVALVYPEEGFHGWYDGPCVVREAPNPDAAYAFIDFLLSPEIQAATARELGYSPANAEAAAFMDPELRKLLGLDNAKENIEGLHILENFGAAFNQRATETWQRVKNQANR